VTTFIPGYRLTMYAPRSVDPTETTVLVPAAGAPHSDPFQITTLPSLAGYKPYLASVPTNRRGRIDPLSKKVDVGQIVVSMMDPTVVGTTGQLSRWLTSFFGDASGRPRWMGLKVLISETLDGGATWDVSGLPFWTGRVRLLKEMTKNQFDCTIWDLRTDLKMMFAVGQPHVNVQGYAGLLSLMPLGVQVAWGTLVPPLPFTGQVANLGPTTGISLALDSASRTRLDNIVTQEFIASVLPGNLQYDFDSYYTPQAVAAHYGGTGRVRIKWTSGANNGLTGVYRVGWLGMGPRDGNTYMVGYIQVAPLADPTAPGYLTLGALNDTFQWLAYWRENVPVGVDNPLFINDRHPALLMQDVAAGYFGYLYQFGEKRPAGKNLGDPKRSVPVSAGPFGTLVADTSFPPVRFIITKQVMAGDFIEQQLGQSSELGYFLDPSGTLVPIDLRRPSTLPSATLTDADVIAGRAFDWNQDQSTAVQRVDAKYYKDVKVRLTDFLKRGGGPIPSAQSALVQTIPMGLTVFDVGVSDLAVDKVVSIDAQGYRSMDGESLQNVRRDDYIPRALEEMIRSLTQPYGSGAITCTLPCRRTTVPTAAKPGDLLNVVVSWLPDPYTLVRGGARVMRVLEKTEQQLEAHLVLLDLGNSNPSTAPTIGNPVQEAGNTSHGVTSLVTLFGTLPVELHVAVTPTTQATAPPVNDATWRFYQLVTASGTVAIHPLPAGMRIWVRGRSLPSAYDLVQQPSAWVVTTSVDLTALAAPTGLTITNIGSTIAVANWTVGDATLRIEIRLSQPNGQPYVPVATLLPGSNTYRLYPLDFATTIGIQVLHTDGAGGYSAALSTTFTTLGANLNPQLPPPYQPHLRVYL
jgi:hypothetical protein